MDFNSQLSRMKGLMTYGTQVNEDARPISTCSLEYRAKAADGKTYGIIREGHRYYIKSASAGQEAIAESYQYLGGFNNKNDYMYDSYAKALKNFELKMASINEACDGKVNIQTLNPFRANEVLVEGTKKMKNEIARQRQIMYNAAMLMNEESGIGKAPFASQPESEHANSGDEDTPFTQSVTANMDFDGKNAETPKSQSEPYGKGGKAPKGKDVQVKDSVAGAHPSGGKVARVNEGVEGETEHDPSELADLLKDNLVRFTFIKAKDGSIRHACGTQNIDIAKEWGAAIPTGAQPERPGHIPFIDLDMKEADMKPEDVAKGRFWKSCLADNVESIDEVISVDEIMGGEGHDEPEIEGAEGEENIAGLPGDEGVDEEISDLEGEDEFEGEGDEFGGEGVDESDEDFEEDEFNDEEGHEFDDEDEEDHESDDEDEFDLDDIESDDEARKAAEDDMKDVYGKDYIPMDEEDDDLEDFDDEEDMEGEDEGFEDDAEDDFDEEGEDIEPESEGGVDETDPESVRDEIERLQSVLDDLESGEEGDEAELEPEDDEEGDEAELEPEGDEEGEEDIEGEDIEPEDEEGEPMNEARLAVLNRLARRVASNILLKEQKETISEEKLAVLNKLARKVASNILMKEETLHDFGNHPGYRKKPVELPETGEDQNEHGKDWNDDSVHSEEPFGQSKGDSKPYSNTLERDALAMKITDKVMESLKKRG